MKYSKFALYVRLMRLDKPIGILLLLWPTLIALWIAGNGRPDPLIVAVFITGVIVMRSAGCVVNDLADRHFDKAVARTKHRPLAAGALTPREAVLLFCILLILAFILVFQLNFFTIAMSFIGLLLAVIYPFMKRYTALPQVVLGAAFGWAVPMAFMAISHHISKEALLLYLITIAWAVVYDTQYAMVDKKDDMAIGIKSTAILFGALDRVIIGVLQLMILILFVGLGYRLQFGKFYYTGVLVAGCLALYQQYLIKDRVPERCFKAFLNNNFFGAVVFMGVALEYI